MIIILEGADGSGKSTFADRLHQQIPFAWRMSSGPFTGDPFAEYETRLDVYDGYTPIIADRWHLGELVYGPKYRGESKIDDVARWHIEAYLCARGALQVGVLTPPELAAARLADRGDDMVDPDDVAEITTTYHTLFNQTRFMTVSFQCDEPNDPEDSCGHMQCVLTDSLRVWSDASPLKPFKTYVGSTNPRYLVLGDVREDETYTASFVPTPNSDSRFLLEHLLPVTGDNGHEIGFASACEEDVVSLWQALGQPMVVALGGIAYDAVMASINTHGGHRFPLGGAPSPLYVKTYHPRFGAQYARTIISALETQEDLRSWRPA